MQNAATASDNRPARTSSGLAPLFATAGDLVDFVRWALTDPCAAASALADRLDRRCTHHERGRIWRARSTTGRSILIPMGSMPSIGTPRDRTRVSACASR